MEWIDEDINKLKIISIMIFIIFETYIIHDLESLILSYIIGTYLLLQHTFPDNIPMAATIKQSLVSSSPCAFCQLHVRPSRHAPQCSQCNQWQHRVCHRGNKSGVTHEEYLVLREGRIVFSWQCVKCPQPGRQISHVGTDAHKTTPVTMETSIG